MYPVYRRAVLLMTTRSLTASDEFRRLQSHFAEVRDDRISDLFAADADRFEKFSLRAAGLLFDYSKNRLHQTTLDLLLQLARAQHVEARRDAMFSGQRINLTEERAVLHTALRAPRTLAIRCGEQDVSVDVHAVLDQMQAFCARIRSGSWTGFDGRPITDIINIGIGGSYLGPKMVCQALQAHGHPRLTSHFVSNVDGHDLAQVLAKINPATSLFIIASKSFSTAETMMNAYSARKWFLASGNETDLAKHFVAVSTNLAAVSDFGIDPQNMFPFWDWVGGRYSIWSAIGLSVAVMIGFDAFTEFLAGAHQMDLHFKHAPLEQNMPVLLAMIGIWYRNFFGSSALSIAPYHHGLSLFSGYLQQLEMESNGKSIDLAGVPVGIATSPVIWGDTGTNGQHAYFQMLHQGSDVIPSDFIAVLKPSHTLSDHHAVLLANCFAQSEALMLGKSEGEVRLELQQRGMPQAAIDAAVPHRAFPGNRPSNTIVMDALTPATLGALIALYEHKVFVQGVVWNVNSFDQWGVELGKVMATTIVHELRGETSAANHDGSTNALIALATAALRSP